MYILQSPPVPYHPPWDQPFSERLSMLMRGNRRIAYYYTEPDTSTFRYRVYNMVQAIQSAEDGVSASWFHRLDLDRMREVLQQVDVLVICRVMYSLESSLLITLARNARVRILYDVDDLVFDTDYAHLLCESLDIPVTDAALYHMFGLTARHGQVLKQCDGAVTTNSFLAAKIEAFFGNPAAVVPNFLNRIQMLVSGEFWQEKIDSGFERDDTVCIGYFSGSPSHNRDFRVASAALLALMREDPRLRLRLVGFLDPGTEWHEFRDRVEVLPLMDYLNLQRAIAEVEINIAPLQDNVFTNCKSELKYFEAAVCGALTLATPTHTFRESIRDGENGWLCNAQEWDTKLRTAINALEAPRPVLEAARSHALESYGWHTHRGRILQALLPDQVT